MKVVGVTGGIGSGKTTVCRIFSFFGIPVYNADQRAKDIYHEDVEVQREVKRMFGDDVYLSGQLDRKKVASIVFRDREKLEQLNGLVHPAVQRDFQKWLDAQRGVPYVIKEAAIMIEVGTAQLCDAVVLVSAPEELRIQRVMERDNIGREEVEARLQKQWSDDRKRPHAHFEIVNDGERSLIDQVRRIHAELAP